MAQQVQPQTAFPEDLGLISAPSGSSGPSVTPVCLLASVYGH